MKHCWDGTRRNPRSGSNWFFFFPHDERFLNPIKKFFRRLLRERGIACRAVNGVGMELLTEKEQVHWCPLHRQRKALRQTSKAMNELDGVADSAALSVHDRKLAVLQKDHLKLERKALRRGLKAGNEKKKTECLPIRKLETVPT